MTLALKKAEAAGLLLVLSYVARPCLNKEKKRQKRKPQYV